MKNKIILVALFCIGCLYMSSAQIIGDDAFLKNDFLELGVGRDGAFGTSANAPVGFHPRPDYGATTGRLGFVADADEDGWDVGTPNYCGDFFVPGAPVENLTLSIGSDNYTNNWLEGYLQIPGDLSNYVDNTDETSVEWSGDVAGINVFQKIELPKENNYIIMSITLTNTSEVAIEEIYFSRNVDPDNEATLDGGSYATQNTILSNPDGTTDQAIVEAVGTLYGCTVALGAINPIAKAVYGGFSNRDAEDLYNNGSGLFYSTVGDTEYEDSAIAISFNVGTLEAGESIEMTLGYLLDPDDINEFLVDLAAGPTIQCKDISVPLVGSSTVVMASDLDDGTMDDDTAPEDIVFSFSETDMTDITLNFNCSGAGSFVEVTIWAWDAEGTISEPCTSTITIVDTEAPVIVCPEDIIVSSDPDMCGAAVFFSTFASDNCGVGSDCSLNQPTANTAYSGWQGGGADFVACDDGVIESITIYFDGNLASSDLELSIYDGANPNTASVIHTQTVLGSSLVVGSNTIVLTSPVSVTEGEVNAFTFEGNNNGMEINSSDVAPNTIMYCFGGVSWDIFASWDVKYDINIESVSSTSCTLSQTVANTAYSGWQGGGASFIGCGDGALSSVTIYFTENFAGEDLELAIYNGADPNTSAVIHTQTILGSSLAQGPNTVALTAEVFISEGDAGAFTFEGNNDGMEINSSDVAPNTIMYCKGDSGWTTFASWDVKYNINFGPSTPVSCSHTSGDIFPIGTTTVTCSATDASGLTSSCSFDITVEDNENPKLIVMDATLEITTTSVVTLEISDVLISADDNCGVLDVVLSQTEFDCDDVGDNELVITVTDVNGNTAQETVIVTVEDNSVPMVDCPIGIFTELEGFDCELRLVMPPVTWMDVCGDGTAIIVYSADDATFQEVGGEVIGNFETAGLFDVLVTVTDTYGNVGECNFIVKVDDNLAPIIDNCQFVGPIEVQVEFDCGANVEWEELVEAKDNCDLLSEEIVITSSHDSGDFFEFGTTEVVYTATDNNGNTATCSFDVIVGETLEASYTLTGFNGLTIAFGNTSIGGIGYLWDFGDGSTSTATNPTHTFPSEGVFEVCLTVIGECGSDEICHDMKANFNNLSINEVAPEITNGLTYQSVLEVGSTYENVSFNVYPNPTNGLAYMNLDFPTNDQISIVVTDRLGKVVNNLDNISCVKGQQKINLQTENLSSGLYYLRVYSKGALINQVKQLVIMK